MDTFFAVMALALVGVVIVAAVKQENRIIALCISIALCVVLLLFLLPQLSDVLATVRSLTQVFEGSDTAQWLSLLLKVTVIALMGEWAIALCRDAGEGALSVKLEIAVKIILLCMSIPVFVKLIELMISVLEGLKLA